MFALDTRLEWTEMIKLRDSSLHVRAYKAKTRDMRVMVYNNKVTVTLFLSILKRDRTVNVILQKVSDRSLSLNLTFSSRVMTELFWS